MQRVAPRAQEAAGNACAAHHLDARNALGAEEQGDLAQDVRGDGLGHADLAAAVAVRAVHEVRLVEARAHALAGHLHDAEVADLQRRRLGAVTAQVVVETGLDLAPVLRRAHVDEVVDDDAAEVAQAELAGDLVHRLLVGVEGVGLAVARAAALAAVHVDGHHRLGLVDHQRAARGERHLARVDLLHLALHAEGVEDRRHAVVEEELGRVDGRHHLQEGLGAGEGALAVHHDGLDAVVGHVADGADQEVALRVERAGRARGVRAAFHGLPEALEVDGVALQLGLGAVEAGRAQDEAEALRQLEAVEDAAHLAALVLVVHLAADADLVHLRHHHEEAPRDGDVAREGRALGADAFLEHLHDDLLAALERFLDGRTVAAGDLLADALGALLAGEVLRVEVGDVEEAVLALAEVDERRLDGGLDVHHASLVDVADVGRGVLALGEDLLEAPVLEERDAALLARVVVDHHHRAALGAHGAGLLRLLLAATAAAAATALAAAFLVAFVGIGRLGALVGLALGVFAVLGVVVALGLGRGFLGFLGVFGRFLAVLGLVFLIVDGADRQDGGILAALERLERGERRGIDRRVVVVVLVMRGVRFGMTLAMTMTLAMMRRLVLPGLFVLVVLGFCHVQSSAASSGGSWRNLRCGRASAGARRDRQRARRSRVGSVSGRRSFRRMLVTQAVGVHREFRLVAAVSCAPAPRWSLWSAVLVRLAAGRGRTPEGHRPASHRGADRSSRATV